MFLAYLTGPASAELAGQNNGAGIQAEPVSIGSGVPANSTHKLNVSVYNTGTDTETLNLTVQNLSHHKTLTVQPSWVAFSENNFSIGAGETKNIGVTLSIPDVPDGYYTSDIWVRTVSSSGDGAFLGAGAATLIEFKVGHGKANFAQFTAGGGHLTKKQQRRLNRAERKAEHARASSGGSSNGFGPAGPVIGVGIMLVFAFGAFTHLRHHRKNTKPKTNKNKNKAVKDYKNNHEDAQAKKERNAKMRNGGK